MRKLRVLIIENALNFTGGVNSIVRSSEALSNEFEFHFICPVGNQISSHLKEKGFEVHELPMKELNKSILAWIIYLPYLVINAIRLRRIIKKLDIDVVCCNDFYNLLPAAYKFFGGKVPYVCYVRFLPSKFPSLLVTIWCSIHERYAENIIAVSNAVKKELPNQNKVVVIGNELPQSEEVVYAADQSTLLLYPANYIQGKGHDYALESFGVLAKKYPQWKLRFTGSDMNLQKNKDFKAKLMSRAQTLGIANQVELLGFEHDVARLYKEASIVLNFSESESFSLTCLEAMFYGRSIIATTSGGPSEIIDADETGILVPVNDVNAMTNAIEFLINHSKERNEMALKAYHTVRIKFSNQNTVQKLGKVYCESIQDKIVNF